MSNWMWHPYFLNILDVDVDVVLNILDVMGVNVDVDGYIHIHIQHSVIFGFERLLLTTNMCNTFFTQYLLKTTLI